MNNILNEIRMAIQEGEIARSAKIKLDQEHAKQQHILKLKKEEEQKIKDTAKAEQIISYIPSMIKDALSYNRPYVTIHYLNKDDYNPIFSSDSLTGVARIIWFKCQNDLKLPMYITSVYGGYHIVINIDKLCGRNTNE